MVDADGKSKKFGFVCLVGQESTQKALTGSVFIQFGDSQAYCAVVVTANELERRSVEGSRNTPQATFPVPQEGLLVQPCGALGYPGTDFGGQPFGFAAPGMQFPGWPFGTPVTPAVRQFDRDMTEAKIMERCYVQSQLLRRLRDLSDCQCKALTQNKYTDSVLIQTFGKNKERHCESFIQKKRRVLSLDVTVECFPLSPIAKGRYQLDIPGSTSRSKRNFTIVSA